MQPASPPARLDCGELKEGSAFAGRRTVRPVSSVKPVAAQLAFPRFHVNRTAPCDHVGRARTSAPPPTRGPAPDARPRLRRAAPAPHAQPRPPTRAPTLYRRTHGPDRARPQRAGAHRPARFLEAAGLWGAGRRGVDEPVRAEAKGADGPTRARRPPGAADGVRGSWAAEGRPGPQRSSHGRALHAGARR